MLTAIPVGQGDAFLLRREGGPRILVDGGRSRIALPGQVARIGGSTLDVVVCTHADADHAEGLIGLLEAGETQVKEVWLPGRWSEQLVELLSGDPGWFDELANDIEETDKTNLEEIGIDCNTEKQGREGRTKDVVVTDKASLEEIDIDCNTEEQGREARTPEVGDLLEADIDIDTCWPSLLSDFTFDRYWPSHPRSPKIKLWIEAIKTANRIRSVALAAHHHGARIRWFDFDEAQKRGAPNGGEPFLRPMNAHEITPIYAKRKLGALRFLALSVANRESLVFAAPEFEAASGVVFTADSDMVCSQHLPKFARPVVVTAPHHGAESNGSAYAAVSAALGATAKTWVRSDGNYSKRPGVAYLAQQAPRACTLCRNGGVPKQAVVLDDTPNGWMLRGSPCRCK